jgi:hypothetical protein
MLNVTRDVVADLWPVYEAGEASADTRALVDEFLATDPAFARTLLAAPRLEAPAVKVAPEAKLAALKRTRDLVHGNAWLRGLRLFALVITVFAIKRILDDTSWDVSPRVFIADATIATISWTAYGVFVNRYRKRSLRA